MARTLLPSTYNKMGVTPTRGVNTNSTPLPTRTQAPTQNFSQPLQSGLTAVAPSSNNSAANGFTGGVGPNSLRGGMGVIGKNADGTNMIGHFNQSPEGGLTAPHFNDLTAGTGNNAPIVAPSYVNIADTFKTLKDGGLLPEYSPVQGLGEDYYSNLAAQSSKRLNEKYFKSPDSVLAQRENQIKRRGLFGSGIGENATNQVYKDFGSELANFESQLSTQHSQNDLDLSKYNNDNKNKLSELGLSAAGDEAKRLSDYQGNIFNAEIKQNENKGTDVSKQIDQINSALGNNLLDPESRNVLKAKLFQILGIPLPAETPTPQPPTQNPLLPNRPR